jgi:hypothetical protein
VGKTRDVNLVLFKVATLSLLRVNNSGLEAEDGAAAYGGYTKW